MSIAASYSLNAEVIQISEMLKDFNTAMTSLGPMPEAANEQHNSQSSPACELTCNVRIFSRTEGKAALVMDIESREEF